MTGSKILIVEDEKITAMAIRSSLVNMGYVVCGETSFGEEAVTLVKTLAPDVVLMDITLRGNMDGIEAASKIKTDFDIPVIFLTAHEDNGTLGLAKAAEPYAYLLKPFRERELQISIEMALYKHEMENERKALTLKLKEALAQVRTLSGILPICSSCKKIRNDKGCWQRIEEYVSHHTDAEFSHGICPECTARLYPELTLDVLKGKTDE